MRSENWINTCLVRARIMRFIKRWVLIRLYLQKAWRAFILRCGPRMQRVCP